MRAITFEGKAFEEYQEWAKQDKKIFFKINELIQNIARSPFEGIGKPEPLRHELKGFWSRRIDHKNRLIYRISEAGHVVIVSCKNHY